MANASKRAMWHVVLLLCYAENAEVVVSSVSRGANSGLVYDSLTSMVACSAFQHGVHVYGYNPAFATPGIVGHPMPASPQHAAYRWVKAQRRELVPRHAMANGKKTAYLDSATRAAWRTQLNLDAWHVLAEAYVSRTADIVVWIENDGFVDSAQMRRALAQFRVSPASGAACYGREGVVYGGGGAVCMMFKRSALPAILQHVLGFHMVQPFDWILSDYAAGTWTTYNACSHGRAHARHASTLDE